MTTRQPTQAEIDWALDRQCEESFLVFAAVMHKETKGTWWDEQPCHRLIANFVNRAFTGKLTGGLINISPRAGKTQFICMWIAWAFGKYPDSEFIYATYSQDLSEQSAIMVRQVMLTPRYKRIFPKTVLDRMVAAREKFHTTAGGKMLARGVGSTITGYGAGKYRGESKEFGGALIFDDLHKLTEARSAAEKLNVKNFYVDTLNTRRNTPNTPVIGIGQRVAVDDIFGLLDPKEGESLTGEKFETLLIPVFDESGNSFWEARFPKAKYEALKRAQPWTFHTQYMQNPYNPQGEIFLVDMMPVLSIRPSGKCVRVRAWDLAAREKQKGKTEPDYTATILLAYYEEHRLYVIEHAQMFRGTPDKVRAVITATALRDGPGVRLRLPQDPGQAGVDQAQNLVEMIGKLGPEYKVTVVRPTGDKVTRAEPAAAQLNVGLVAVLAAYDELVKSQFRPFDSAPFDDLVDAFSDAYAELAIPDEDEASRRAAVRALERASKFSFGEGGERIEKDPEVNPYGETYALGEEPI